MTNLILSGMFDRHPDLKMVSVESGVGWIPFILEALDYEMAENAPQELAQLKKPPSEYFRSNLYATFWFENNRNKLPDLIEAVGEDNILFETDFPHPTCLYPTPLDTVAAKMTTLPPRPGARSWARTPASSTGSEPAPGVRRGLLAASPVRLNDHGAMLLKCCLNGARSRSDHPACPMTPPELARDASIVAAAGAMALHVHPRDAEGIETLDRGSIGEALSAIRESATVPVGVSTGAWILHEAHDRLRAIDEWDILPDFASVNFHESGATDVARLLAERGVGVEAGLWHETRRHSSPRAGSESGAFASCSNPWNRRWRTRSRPSDASRVASPASPKRSLGSFTDTGERPGRCSTRRLGAGTTSGSDSRTPSSGPMAAELRTTKTW